LASEFKYKSAEAAINTMVERPSVNHAGHDWRGRSQAVDTLYDSYFIPQMPRTRRSSPSPHDRPRPPYR
jgi:hypothetical protein